MMVFNNLYHLGQMNVVKERLLRPLATLWASAYIAPRNDVCGHGQRSEVISSEVICMKVTPLEVRQEQFPLRFRGYDPRAVDAFLELVAGALEDLLKERIQLREALAQQDQEIQGIRQEQGGWKKTLMTAQQTAEDLIGRGKKRARAIVAAAERKAQRMLMEAEQQREAITYDVQELERRRRKLILQIRRVLEQHFTLLETQEVDSEEKRSDDAPKLIVDATEVPQHSCELEQFSK
jgi:cell division initiation protein